MTEYEKTIKKSMIDKGIALGDLAKELGCNYKSNLSTSIRNRAVSDRIAFPMYDYLGLDKIEMYKLKVQDEND